MSLTGLTTEVVSRDQKSKFSIIIIMKTVIHIQKYIILYMCTAAGVLISTISRLIKLGGITNRG